MFKNIAKRAVACIASYVFAMLVVWATGISIYRSYFIASIILSVIFAVLYYKNATFRLQWQLETKRPFSEEVKADIIIIIGTYLFSKMFHIDFFVMYMICDFAGALRVSTECS